MLMAPVGIASIGLNGALLAEAHDRALAELLLDLADGQFDGLDAFLLVVAIRRHDAPSEGWRNDEPGRPAHRGEF